MNTISPRAEAVASKNQHAGAFPPVPGSAGFRVHLYVCGKWGGAYEFATEAEAVADMEHRRRDCVALHCGYVLERPKPRCPACASHHELLTGLGMWEDSQDCDHLPNNKVTGAAQPRSV